MFLFLGVWDDARSSQRIWVNNNGLDLPGLDALKDVVGQPGKCLVYYRCFSRRFLEYCGTNCENERNLANRPHDTKKNQKDNQKRQPKKAGSPLCPDEKLPRLSSIIFFLGAKTKTTLLELRF